MSLSRIAVIAYHSSPLLRPGSGDAGGMTVYVRGLTGALADRGIHTDIFTRAAAPGVLHVASLRPGVRVVTIEAGPRAAIPKERLTPHVRDFAAGMRAFSTANAIRYDVLHSHYWQSGLAARDLRGAWGTPWVHSQHTLAKVKNDQLAPGDVPEPQSRIQGEEVIMSEADVLIASTDDEWRQLSCLYGVPHDRLKTIHPGVDHSIFRPGDRVADRASLGIGDEAVLVCAGRIQPLKGVDLAIKALQRLDAAVGRKVVLFVIGGPSGATGNGELRRLEGLASTLGVRERVRFVGARDHDEIAPFLRAADAVLVCSHSESFGLVALEAHACGTPVVGTALEGLSHIVQDGITGFLVDTRDPHVFASRIQTLVTDEERRAAMGYEAERVAHTFSWAKSAEAMADLYECLVRERWPQLCTC